MKGSAGSASRFATEVHARYRYLVATAIESWDALFESLGRFKDGWPGKSWSYDSRMRCVVSAITLESAAAAEAAIAEVLTQSWTTRELATAPDTTRATTQACGGLREGQKIYWGGSTLGAFGLWWPWGDGQTVSLRVGLHDVDSPTVRYSRLRHVFGIPHVPTESLVG